MTETRINSDFLERMKKTRVRNVRECPDVSGLVFIVKERIGVRQADDAYVADLLFWRSSGRSGIPVSAP